MSQKQGYGASTIYCEYYVSLGTNKFQQNIVNCPGTEFLYAHDTVAVRVHHVRYKGDK